MHNQRSVYFTNLDRVVHAAPPIQYAALSEAIVALALSVPAQLAAIENMLQRHPQATDPDPSVLLTLVRSILNRLQQQVTPTRDPQSITTSTIHGLKFDLRIHVSSLRSAARLLNGVHTHPETRDISGDLIGYHALDTTIQAISDTVESLYATNEYRNTLSPPG